MNIITWILILIAVLIVGFMFCAYMAILIRHVVKIFKAIPFARKIIYDVCQDHFPMLNKHVNKELTPDDWAYQDKDDHT